MRGLLPVIGAFLLSLAACRQGAQGDERGVLVSVNGKSLARSEVEALIPRTLSSADSLLMAESYVKKWIKEALVYDVAERNLGAEKAEIDRLVEDYKRSLVRYRYQEQLVREKLSASIDESELRAYYDAHPDEFILKKVVLKGLFLKVPADAPGLGELKVWYKSGDADAMEKIEKYSLQNAAIYDYFYDKWMDFDDVIDRMPLRIANPSAYLKGKKQVEATDSLYCYLLNVREFIPAGEVAPYDYVQPQILDMLLARRKVAFLRKFEEELYNDAIRDGEVRFSSSEPESKTEKK